MSQVTESEDCSLVRALLLYTLTVLLPSLSWVSFQILPLGDVPQSHVWNNSLFSFYTFPLVSFIFSPSITIVLQYLTSDHTHVYLLSLMSCLSTLWHCLSLGLEWKPTFSSPVATNRDLPDVQAGFRKGRGTRDQPTSVGSLKKQESSRKTSISALLTMPKPLCGSQ